MGFKGEATFEGIIKIENSPDTNKCDLTADGRYCLNGECMLIPSKDQKDGSKWKRPFVDGDIVTCDGQIAIFKKYVNIHSGLAECYVFLDLGGELDLYGGNFYVKKIATEEEKQKLFDAIKKNGYEWDAEKKELKKIEEKFDPTSLQPFDKVLVRDGDGEPWGISLFSYLKEYGYLRFSCTNLAPWRQCVPYNDDTKHLVGICDMAPEKYINW